MAVDSVGRWSGREEDTSIRIPVVSLLLLARLIIRQDVVFDE